MSKITFPSQHASACGTRPFGLMDLLRAWSERRRRARCRRDGYRKLLPLDDDILADIGLSRGEVERGARIPPSLKAAKAAPATGRKWH